MIARKRIYIICTGLVVITLCIFGLVDWRFNTLEQRSIAIVDSVIADKESIDKLLSAYDRGMKAAYPTNYNDVFNMTDFLRDSLKTHPQAVFWEADDVLHVQMSSGFFRSGILVCGAGKTISDMRIESNRARKVTDRIYRYP